MVDVVKGLPRGRAAMRGEGIWIRHGSTTPPTMLILVAPPWSMVHAI